MRLVYCITRSDTLGGAHIHVGDMAAWMRQRGHDAHVVVGGEGPYCEHLAAKGVPYTISEYLCRPIRPVADLRAVLELRHIFRQLDPDVLSLHSAKAGLVGRLASMGRATPVLFTAHGWAFTEGVSPIKAMVFRMLEWATAPLADRIITVSEYDRRLALEAGVGKPETMQTIHNAMPETPNRADPGQNCAPVRIAMVARLDEPKDHQTLVSALASLKNRSWLLDLVGDGPHEEWIRGQVRRFGMEDRVRFLGLRQDVDEVLADSHIFVLTSRWEGFPRSILEAMRAGLPVVASAVGGIPESVEDGETGYLLGKGGVSDISNRLAYLIDNPEERARLGNNGRQRFDERYRFERMAEETLSVYDALLQRRACAFV